MLGIWVGGGGGGEGGGAPKNDHSRLTEVGATRDPPRRVKIHALLPARGGRGVGAGLSILAMPRWRAVLRQDAVGAGVREHPFGRLHERGLHRLVDERPGIRDAVETIPQPLPDVVRPSVRRDRYPRCEVPGACIRAERAEGKWEPAQL